MNIPRWLWTIIWVVVALIVLVLLKVNINLGYGGFSVTQGLIR